MLPINFHQTFIPERRYVSSLLQYAASGSKGTLDEIAEQTGIPMGKSSGKAHATIDYARGMNLIELASLEEKLVKKPTLTSFGAIVYAEDRFLGEQVTQWIAHMNLCSSYTGARAWHEVFAKGRNTLGARFSTDQLEKYLVTIFGPTKTRRRTGPLVLTYVEQEALARSGALTIDRTTVIREKAPVFDAYAIPYSAYILHLMETFFPGQNQVTLSDFNNETLLFDICLWNQSDIECVLSIAERKNFISIDRQMQPWIIEKRANANDVWPLIYSEIA